MSKVAVVLGGSGFVGRHVVRELAKRGWRVRVGVRRPHHAMHLKPMGAVGQIQLAQVNVRHQGSIEQALHGADAVINLVGILHQDWHQKFAHVQTVGAANIAQACSKIGIDRLIHISAIGADADSESLYASSKGKGESAVLEHMPEATILRPSIIFGPEDNFFNRFASMASLSPLVMLPLIGGGTTKLQPVYVDDVADSVCQALENTDSLGKVYELGGPQVYSFKELLQLMLKEMRVKRLLAPIPYPIASLIGLGGEIFGALPFVEPFLTRDQVQLLKRDNVVSDKVGTIEDFGVTPKSVESILPSYMVQYRKYGQFNEEEAPVSPL